MREGSSLKLHECEYGFDKSAVINIIIFRFHALASLIIEIL